MICRRYLISGRVQGVFYRASARRYAQSLGLTGWVRNRRDGSVELLACGEEQVLQELEKWLRIGPDYAKVTNIRVTGEKPSIMPETFDVLPTA
jgi:acylphosphatase